MKEKEYDIHDRIFKFVIDIISLLNKLPKTQTNLIFIKQCIRSVTSMGLMTRKRMVHLQVRNNWVFDI